MMGAAGGSQPGCAGVFAILLKKEAAPGCVLAPPCSGGRVPSGAGDEMVVVGLDSILSRGWCLPRTPRAEAGAGKMLSPWFTASSLSLSLVCPEELWRESRSLQ